MGSGRRGILVAVMALILAVNNGAFATLGFIGVNSPGSTASVRATLGGQQAQSYQGWRRWLPSLASGLT